VVTNINLAIASQSTIDGLRTIQTDAVEALQDSLATLDTALTDFINVCWWCCAMLLNCTQTVTQLAADTVTTVQQQLDIDGVISQILDVVDTFTDGVCALIRAKLASSHAADPNHP
jgi:hypothetical protein